MIQSFEYQTHILNFRRPAGTSRGVLDTKTVGIIKLKDHKGSWGLGEVSTLPQLSYDADVNYEKVAPLFLEKLIGQQPEDAYEKLQEDDFFMAFPALKMGLEMAFLDLMHDGFQEYFTNPFSDGQLQIPINGLVWMNDAETMLAEVQQKIIEGFSAIKLKIGALNYAAEIDLIQKIRKNSNIEIRVDANGAFDELNAKEVLSDLAKLQIHSIEQPIKAGQIDAMARLCAQTPVPIALDEELIGVDDIDKLLDEIKPQMCIFKPSLLGGFYETQKWIKACQTRNVYWWITSALESNIGLNAICQFAAETAPNRLHGLGTGALYTNNFKSNLTVAAGYIFQDFG